MSGHCRDCGEQLDQFGACPFADGELVRLSRAPVYCGRSADRNAVTIAGEIFHALRPGDVIEASHTILGPGAEKRFGGRR